MGCLVDPPAVVTAATDYPEVCIEWLPTVGPNAPDGDWCDITAYVSLEGNPKIKRGRQFELDRFQAGTFSLTLKAATRLFDPEYTSGPFFPYLVPMRQIRASAVWNGVRYSLFRGFITSWGQTQPDDAMFVSTISCKDGFERLEQRKLPSSAWALEVQKDDPTCWLRLGESDTPRVTDSSPGGNYGVYDNCQQGAQGLVVNDSDGAVAFAHSLEERVKIQNPIITGYPFTMSLAFKISGDDPAGFKTLFWGALHPPLDPLDVAGGGITIVMTPNTGGGIPGRVYVAVGDGPNYRGTYLTSAQLDDELPHLIHAAWSSASAMTAYLDGVAVADANFTRGTGAPAWSAIPTGYYLGNTSDIGTADFGFGVNDATFIDEAGNRVYPLKERGTIDEFTIYDGSALTATRAAAQYAAFLGWDGDDTGERVSRFLDAIDWPVTLRDIDTGASTLGPASWSQGSSALGVLQGWADTETGQFFMDTEGKLVWKSRHAPLLDTNAVTSQATFGDGHSAATLKYDNNGLDLPRDETLIRNPVTAGRQNGVTVTVSDATGIDKYGERAWSAPTTEDQKDSAVRDRAMWLLAKYKEQGTRLAAMTISPRRDPSNLWPQVLGLKHGDRITVKRTPLGVGNETSIDVIIEGISHDFGPKRWKTTFVGSPVDPNVGDYMINDDPVYGLLDTALMAY